MIKRFERFIRSEDGAVTVDWVVLTAAVAGLAVAAITSIHGSSGNVGVAIRDYLTAIIVG